ncbi:2,4-dienoyl-CoA reductase [alpha proteobacterium BAL199]|jgi:dimethylglycine catabolism A|nr:2,4-dienoyl-CoA reductase [alpha proteobacterium BAL199]
MSAFEHLSRPLRFGALRLKNRVAHAAILTRYAAAERVTDRLIAYHRNRAQGGVSMIVTEAVNALPSQAGRGAYLNAHSDAGLPDLARLASAVTHHDCRILAQLQERGRGNYSRARVDRTFAPSALPDDLTGAVPHALSTGEVEAMVDAFAAAAGRLQRAGFDGVEVSAGHGHLFHQFLSAHSNRRTDRFGGDLDGRMTLLRELVAAIRSACGRDFVLGLKLPAEDGDPAGIDLAQAGQIASALSDPQTIDYVAFAWGAQNRQLHWHIPDGHWPRASYAEKTAELRRDTNGVPVMGLARIVDPNEGEAMLARDQADFIGVGRALIADPAWTGKALSGRSHAIRPCVSCNTCWGAIAEPASLVCDTNPDLGTAAELSGSRPRPGARQGRRVVVVGGGIAGLSAAAEAAEAGHTVTLFHASGDLGGRAHTAARLPGGEGLEGVYDFDAARAAAAGVRLERGLTATAQDVEACAPDTIILATGAETPWDGPALDDGLPLPSLRALVQDALRRAGPMGDGLLLIDRDDSIWVYRAAELLADRFATVTVLSEWEVPAQREPLVVRQGMLERLAARRVRVENNARVDLAPDDLMQGAVGFHHLLTGARLRVEGIDAVAHASPRRPRTALLTALRERGHAPQVIGDAYQPRALMQAVAEGRRAGQAIR